MTPLLILGLGNLLCTDDGLGVAAIALLEQRYVSGRGVKVVDGGTLGLSLLPVLEDAESAILVDAINGEGPPGTLVRLEGDEVAHAAAHRLSVHQIGVSDLLDGARLRGRCPPRLILLGLVPGSIELGLGRSAAVEAAVPALVLAVVAEAARLGRPFRERTHARREARGNLHRVLGL